MSKEAATRSFLQSFFSDRVGENLLGYADIREGKKNTYSIMQPWLAGLHKSPHTTVLPRYRKVDGEDEVTWYGVAKTDRGLRRLVDEVRAFVGPTYSDFTGQRASLDPEDPIEAAVAEFTGGNAFTFQGADEEIRDALALMHNVRSQQKQRDARVHRSPGIILRDFHMALAAENEEAAREALQYMREHSLISALNRDFLQIQLHRAFGQWGAVLDMDLEDILAVRRPLAVTEALIQAVYYRHLSRFEEAGDAEGALQRFEEVVRPAFDSLFGMRSTMRAPEVLKSFMLKAVAPDTADTNLRAKLLEEAEAHELDLPFLRNLAELVEDSQAAEEVEAPPARLDEAKRAYDEGNYDRAYDVAVSLDGTVERAEILLLCSVELQSTEADRTAVQAIDALPEADRDRVLDKRLHRQVYDNIIAQDGDRAQAEGMRVPDDWIAWLQRLDVEPGWNRSRALEIAQRGVREWDVEDLLARHDHAAEQLADALKATREEKAERTLLEALPHLLAFLQQDRAYPRLDMQRVYEYMLILVAMTPGKGDADLDLFYILCETLLAQGVTEEHYREIVDTAAEIWKDVAAPRHLTWGLDFMDLLVMFPQRDAEASLRFVQRVVATFRRYRGRAEQGDIVTLQRLCGELGHSDAFVNLKEKEERKDADPLVELEGGSIAIYTLTEQAGRRMKELLEERCEGITVHLSHSKVATRRLGRLARSVDIFLVVTASAAHAATNYIRGRRGDRPLVIPQGKGTSSMMRALRAHVSEGVGTSRV